MILGIAYIICCLSLIGFEIRREKASTIDMLSVANGFYFLGYFLQGACIQFDITYISDLFTNFHPPQSYIDNPIAFIAIVLSYILLVVGYYLSSPLKKWARGLYIKKEFQNFDSTLIIIFTLLFGISFITYTWTYGGYVNALALSNFLRSGNAEIATFSFVKPLLFSGSVLSILIASRVNKLISINALLLFLTVVAVIASYLLLAGRAHIIILLAFVGYTLVKGKIKPVPTTIGIIIFYLIMVYGDAIFAISFYLDSKESLVEIFNRQRVGESNFFKRLVHEFQYPFVSLIISLENISLADLRFLSDRFIAIISFLPDRLVGFSPPDSVAYVNTEKVMGYYDSMCPPGVLAYFVYGYHYLGLILGPLVYGFIGGAINSFFSVNKHIRWIAALQIYVAYQWGGFILSGEPRVDFTAFFALNIALLIIAFRIFLIPKLLNA